MNNAERRRIIQEAKLNGYQGSYVDLFRQAEQNPEGMQKPLFTAVTPEEKEQGLRPLHEAGRTDASMAFTDVPPNTPFNTVGMKAPIDIKKYDEQGHLVKSYENVPPGIQNLDTGPNVGTVLETPSRLQQGGPVKEQAGPRIPMQDTLIRSTASMNLDNDSTYNVRGWLAAGAPGGIDPGDGEFHGASVNPFTGMWLKSKKHETAWKEHLGSQLSPDPFFKKNMSVVNPEGYFGENQLQYVPRNKKQGGGGVPSEDPPKFGIAKNVLERLGTYGKTRQQAEKDPYYEGRYDISKDNVFDFVIKGFRDSMSDQQKADMLNQMASVRELEEGKPVYKSVEGRGHYDPLRNRVYMAEPKKSSTIYRGSLEGEEFTHSLQRLGRFNPSDYGITEENREDFLPGGKEDLPNRYMPFMSYKLGQDKPLPLSKEVEEILALNPGGISDDVYYGGRNPKETEAMLYSGIMHGRKMGILPEDRKITKADVPNIISRIETLQGKGKTEEYDRSIQMIPDHLSRLSRVLQNASNMSEGSEDILLKILNQDLTINPQMQTGGYNPNEYMNKMEPKVFPNQKRDAKWVNYATQHDFAGRFPGEARTNREIGLERSNRNTVPLPPNPVRPKELKRAQEGAFASDNTRVSMPKLQDQEAFNPYSDLHLPPSGRIHYSPFNVEDALLLGSLFKPKPGYKPSPDKYYRGVSAKAYKDAQTTGLIRAGSGEKVYYATGDKGFGRALDYANRGGKGSVIYEVEKSGFKQPMQSTFSMTDRTTTELVPLENATVLSKNFIGKYRPIKKQTGGPKAEGGDPTEDKPVLDAFMMEKFMAEKKGGKPETWRAVADTIGYHESGPWGRMDPKAVQVPSGIGRGIFQFETTDSESFKTAQQRHKNVAKAIGVRPDPDILKANSADELSREQQYLLFYGNLYESPAKLADYTSGKLPLVDLWLQGHKRIEATGNRAAFESSRLDAKRNLRNYPSIGIAPNTTASVDATRTVSPQLQRALDILKRDN